MIFKNREQAAHLLAERLAPYRGLNPLILAIPRGALQMGAIIKDALQGELSVILVRKIGAPGNDEFAVASIGLSGVIKAQPHLKALGIPEEYLNKEAEKQFKILQTRFKNYGLSEERYKNLFADRIIIIVDDGIATGATLLSAIAEVKIQNPQKIIVAAPVASLEALNKIQAAADEVVVLEIPSNFYSVSQFYQSFPQVSDETVIQLLKTSVSND